MAKYRILKREYPDGRIEYEPQKKILGLFWWNFINTGTYQPRTYDTLEEVKRVIERNSGSTKETIVNVE